MEDINSMQDKINELSFNIENKKMQVLNDKLAEKGIVLDMEAEKIRLFKSLHRIVRGEEETIYFNDGSIEGERIVTFKTESPKFDFNSAPEFKINLTWY